MDGYEAVNLWKHWVVCWLRRMPLSHSEDRERELLNQHLESTFESKIALTVHIFDCDRFFGSFLRHSKKFILFQKIVLSFDNEQDKMD